MTVLEHLRVGISVSDSPDLAERGLGDPHLRHAYIELARHVLAAGGSLAYGGDLREDGYTAALLELLETYESPGRPAAERVSDYLAWHLFRQLSTRERAYLAGLATVVGVPAPPDVDPDLPGLYDGTSDLARWSRARCLTAMRVRMTADIDVRVVLGGRTTGGAGFYPGIYEETALAVGAGVPIFLLGGYGGAAARLAAAVRGQVPGELTLSGQLAADPTYGKLVEQAARMNTRISYEDIVAPLTEGSFRALGNRLDEAENDVLLDSWDVDEMIALVMRGLRSIATEK